MPFLALKKCHTCQLCKRCHDTLVHAISKLLKDAALWLRGDVLCVQINMCLHRLLERKLNFCSSWNQIMAVNVHIYEGVKNASKGDVEIEAKLNKGNYLCQRLLVIDVTCSHSQSWENHNMNI